MRVTPSDSTAAARVRLRAELRARRRALSAGERLRAAHLVARNIDRKLGLRAGDRVALYCSLREELDSTPLFTLARRRGWRIFLPRIERTRLSRKMRFVASGGEERINRLGIREPHGTAMLGARWLDAVFVPLVGLIARSPIGAGAARGTSRASSASPMLFSRSSASRPRRTTCVSMRSSPTRGCSGAVLALEE
jgi:5,10-methenyltetrahydrofolate synthetase